MRSGTIFSIAAVAAVCGFSALAQAPAPANGGDKGVNPVRLIDRAEVRVSRVEIQPGAVRSVHTHDDVRFHLWIPVSGKLEITIGSAKPVAAADGQAFFMQKGTPHGFKNVGTTTAVVMEVFVKEGASTAEIQALGATLAALAKPQVFAREEGGIMRSSYETSVSHRFVRIVPRKQRPGAERPGGSTNQPV